MSPRAYYSGLRDFELHGLFVLNIGHHDVVELCGWIRTRVRRSDYVDTHDGMAILIVSNVRAVPNLGTIAARLIHEQPDGALNKPLRFGIAAFETGHDLFNATLADAIAALNKTNGAVPYLVASKTHHDKKYLERLLSASRTLLQPDAALLAD